MGSLAEGIKARRLALRLSVEQAAVASGLTVSMWYKIESGDRTPSVQTLERVAGALGCTVADLFLPPACTTSAADEQAAAAGG